MNTKMRIGFIALAAVMCLATVAVADEATDTYKKIMQPTAAANVNLQKVVATDLAAAATSAADLQAGAAKLEAFWTMRGAADAVGFAKALGAAAKETHDAAAAGNQDAAGAAAKKIGAACGACHMAHRNRLPDGTFELK